MSPSFVLIREMNELTPDAQADLLLAAIADRELAAGAVVTIARGRVRVRRLPFGA